MTISRIFCCGYKSDSESIGKDYKSREKSYDITKTFDSITTEDIRKLMNNVQYLSKMKQQLRLTELEKAVSTILNSSYYTQLEWLQDQERYIYTTFTHCL